MPSYLRVAPRLHAVLAATCAAARAVAVLCRAVDTPSVRLPATLGFLLDGVVIVVQQVPRSAVLLIHAEADWSPSA
jgi:hypothetical protein